MEKSMCGIDCSKCELRSNCKGCYESKGNPFGGGCVIASCFERNKECVECGKIGCSFKEKLINEINVLNIEGMPKVNDLNALMGSYVNIEYSICGRKIKFLNDNKIYLGNQLCKENSDRCYGVVGDEDYILVCEYGENGENAEVIMYKKRKK